MNKKKLIPVISIVVVCAVVFGIYAAVRDSQGSRNEPNIPVPERVASTTVPFETYTNPAAKVSFAIPEDWEQIPGSAVRVESPDFAEEAVAGTNQKHVTAGAAISLEKEELLIDNSDEYVAILEEMQESPECGNCLTGHRITIDGVPAYLAFASIGTSTEPRGAIISFVSGGYGYRLLMGFASYTELSKEILAEVIGTFALTK
ncbi:MAG TPA: hypothetical protein VJA87_01920 [Candidatus Paceibacterota bacterium]